MEGNAIKPPKPAPYTSSPSPSHPRRTPPSTAPPVLPSAHPMPSSGATPPVPGRKSPPSGPPPPIPSRVDLGEAPVDVVSSIKEQSKDDLPKKGSPKLKAKGRPEISIVAARPMDSSGVIPPPSSSSQPAPAPDLPKVPQKSGRKPKGREPPPRPKTRPVSELTLGEDEQDVGPISREGESSHRITEEGGVGMSENTSEAKVSKEGSVPRIAGPVVPARQIPGDKSEAIDVSREKHNAIVNSNLDEKLELTQRAEREIVMKDDQTARKPVVKPTVIKTKPIENTQNDSKPTIEAEEVKETNLDSNAIHVRDAATAKKVKPTVIIAAKPPKKMEAEPGKGKEEEEKDASNVKPTLINSQGGKPPPPAKKPKPPVKAKPSSILQTPKKELTEENKPDKLDGHTAAPKPKMKPTVILAARPPPKISDTQKPSDDESAKNKGEDHPPVKPTAVAEPAEAIQEARDEEKTAASPVVKPRRVPTVIRAPRPDAQDTGEVRKPPNRPQRGPSIKAPSRRPVSVPTEENNELDTLAADSQDESSMGVPEQVTDKEPKPRRPVSIPGVKGNETLTDTKKLNEATSPVEESTALTRKGSRKRPPPPRPPSVEPAGEKVDSSPETHRKTQDQDERSKGKTKPPPPRPPTVEHASEKVDSSPETHRKTQDTKGKTKPPPPRPPMVESASEKVDSSPETHRKMHGPDKKFKEKTKPPPSRPPTVDSTGDTHDKTGTQDHDEKSKVKTKPPRPSSKVLHDKPLKHFHGETGESPTDEKPKPVRPAPVAPSETHVTNKNVAETRTVAESSADGHVQDMSHAHDSVRGVGHSTAAEVHKTNEKASSKAKPRPPRPQSSSFSTKNKPHRPSAPVAKSTKEPKAKTAKTQVSSVCQTYIEPSAIALYDYEPTAIDDLSFNAGDEIALVKKIDDEWYLGRLGDQQGMFPVKFVEIIEDLPQETELEIQPVTAHESSPFDVMSLYDFHGNQQDGELVFAAGEMIHVIEKINDDWLRGVYRERTGTFPCSFVDISTELINKLPQSEANVTVPQSDGGESSDMGLGHCKALFDYDSGVADDLSFNTGDVIKINKKVGEGWFEGEVNGRVGMFPAAYVEMVKGFPEETSRPAEQAKHRSVEYGTALYDFTGTAADELSFEKGDKIEITEKISDDWLRGKLRGQEGMLPRTFVELSKAESAPELQSVKKDRKPTPKAKALFDFEGEFGDELSFKTGDVIGLLERVNEEWFKGEINKKVGRFPAAFVEIQIPLP